MRGYTLVELLVVLVIIAIISLIGFINYKSFAADQIIQKAVGVVQSTIRLAQSNATASVLCNTNASSSWAVKLDSGSIDLSCRQTDQTTDLLQKTYLLENAQIDKLKCGGRDLEFGPPVTLTYLTGAGTLTFSGSDSCLPNAPSLQITIKNIQNPNVSPRPFTISKGGAIDVK